MDRLFDFIETRITNPELGEKVKHSLLEPSLKYIKEEIKQNGYDKAIGEILKGCIFPLLAMLVATFVVCILNLIIGILLVAHALPNVYTATTAAATTSVPAAFFAHRAAL